MQKVSRVSLREDLKQERKIGLRRLLLFSMVFVISITSLMYINLPREAKAYKLNPEVLSILPSLESEVSKKYEFNKESGYFGYNEQLIKESSSEPVSTYFAQLGAGQGGVEPSKIYGARLHEKSSDGVQIYNQNMRMSINVKPMFEADIGGVDEAGYFVYPIKNHDGYLVYTPVINGFKEDIVLNHNPLNGDIKFDYQLELGEYLEARLLDDGAVGIYSADKFLFGEASFGTDSDLDKILEARRNSEKTNLVFYIPPPIISQSGDSPRNHQANVSFSLEGDILSVTSSNLSDLSYPITIDPTLSVTSDADFAEGSNLGFISYPSGGIGRDQLTGGSLTSATNDDSLPAARAEGGLAFYNDYAYYVGGTSNGSDYQTSVYRSTVGASGDLGAWSSLSGDDLLDTATRGHAVVSYNGYMYAIGGEVSGGTEVSTVHYVDFGSSGAIGNWTTTEALPAARDDIAAVAYKGYMYAIGGEQGGTYHDDVYVAAINATGDLEAWSSIGTIPANRAGHDVFVTNDTIYVVGGTDGTVRDTVYYAYLNNDGTIEGSWQTAETLLDATVGLSATTYNGYGYAVGGGNTSSVAQTWVEYTPLNSDGSISLWANSDGASPNNGDLNTARREHSTVAYEGYIYSAGGINGSGTYQSSVERLSIDSAGEISEIRQSANNLTIDHNQFNSAIYNGYIYISGSILAGNHKVYSAPLNEDGTIGSWTEEANNNMRHILGCSAALNGYVYVIGGWDPSKPDTNQDYFTDEVEVNNIESDGTLGSSWTNTTTLPQFNGNSWTNAYRGVNCMAHNGRIYAIGGWTWQSNQVGVQNSKIYYATPNADGTISSWTTNSNNMSTSSPDLRQQNTESFIYNNRIYRQERLAQDIYYADIDPSTGEVSATWTQTTASLSAARYQPGVAVWNGFVYFAAGATVISTSSTYKKSIEYGKIDEDGDISSFVVSNDLPNVGGGGATGLRGVEAVANRGTLVVMGGYNGSTSNNYVQIATIGAGGAGTTGAFTGGTDIGTAIAEHCSVAVNGYLYRIGGDTGSGTEVATVEYSAIAADGDNGAWTSTSSLPAERAGHACTVYNGRIYVSGGTNSSATRQTTVYYAEPESDGSITAWNTASNAFTTAREDLATVAWDDYLYVIGGDTSGGSVATIYYAAIDAGGDLGSFSSTTSMDTARENFAAVAFGGYLYAIGGNDDGSRLDTIEFAQFSGSGGITGSWAYTERMIDPTEGMKAFAINGFIYIIGGLYTDDSGSDAVDDRVKTTYIATNGPLSNTWDIGQDLSVPRWDHGVAEYNGRFYSVGGFTTTAGTTDSLDVEYAGQKAISRKAIYSKVLDLGDRFRITALNYSGTVADGGRVNYDFKMACTDGVFANSVSYEDVTASESAGINVNGRYVLMIVTIDDSRASGFHDEDTTQSSISQIDMEYAYGWTEPDTRLRGGKYFTGGEEQPYDSLEELGGGIVPCD